MKEEYDFSSAKRGAIIAPTPGKVRITIRIDADILDWFRQQVEEHGGGNYQTMINQALRETIQQQQEPLETTLRRVIQEEMQKYKTK